MSETEDNVESSVCSTFEPQAWRKTLCRNCFHNLSEHDGQAAEPVPPKEKSKTDEVPKQGESKDKTSTALKSDGSIKKATPADKLKGSTDSVEQDKTKTLPSSETKSSKKEPVVDTTQKNVPSSPTSKQTTDSPLKQKTGEKDGLKRTGISDSKKVGKLQSSFASKFDKPQVAESIPKKDKDISKSKSVETPKSKQPSADSSISLDKQSSSTDKSQPPIDTSKEVVSKEPEKANTKPTTSPTPSSKSLPLSKSTTDDAKKSISDKNKSSHSKNETDDSKRSASSKFGTKLPASGGSLVQQLAKSKFGAKTDASDVRKGQKNASEKVEEKSETQSASDVGIKDCEGEQPKAPPSVPSSKRTSPSFVKSPISDSKSDSSAGSKEKLSSVSDKKDATSKSTPSSLLLGKKETPPTSAPSSLKKDTTVSPQSQTSSASKDSSAKTVTGKLPESDKKHLTSDIKTKAPDSTSLLDKKEPISKVKKSDSFIGSKDSSLKNDTKKASPAVTTGVSTPSVEVTDETISKLTAQLKTMEEKCKRLEEEKSGASAKMSSKTDSLEKQIKELKSQLSTKESRCSKLESENKDILKKMEKQQSESKSTQGHEKETADLKSRLEQSDHELEILREENERLREEISGMREEMDEMYDSFRDNEIEEIRELQRDLEQTAKNCRVLQFKLRKSDRKNEQLEKDKGHFEEKLRLLQSQFNDDDAKEHIKALEEELKVAKEVSVRLQDDFDLLEDKRTKAEDENTQLTELLEKADKKQFRLEMEIDKLHDKILDMKDDMARASGEIPQERKKPPPSATGMGYTEQDHRQLLRDLYDSVERENDMKDQLRFVEEETKSLRKKVTDLDEENDNLNTQLKKLSNATAAMKRADSLEDKADEDIEESNEVELKVQLEMTEQELSNCLKKLQDKELENERVFDELHFVRGKLDEKVRELTEIPAPSSPSAYYEDQLKQVTKECDDLKWKLIEKERELERASVEVCAYRSTSKRTKGSRLRKTKSLDSEQSLADMKKNLEVLQLENMSLRANITKLDMENRQLMYENANSELNGKRLIPTVIADDAAVENIELRDKVKAAENENCYLNDKIKTLTDSLAQLTRLPFPVGTCVPNIPQEECVSETPAHDQTIADLRNELSELRAEMEEKEREKEEVVSTEKDEQTKASQQGSFAVLQTPEKRDHLIERILDLEDEADVLRDTIKDKESENHSLQDELELINRQMQRMQDDFRQKELDFLREIEMMCDKNSVLNNLLDIVKERAEAAEKELERVGQESGSSSQRSDRSAVSALSGASEGSDEVFLAPLGDKAPIVEKDWETQFKKRIDCLERLLSEERQKVCAAEKKLSFMAAESLSSAMSDDAKLHMREKELLQIELIEYQRHLTIATDQINGLRERLHTLELQHQNLRSSYKSLMNGAEDSETPCNTDDGEPTTNGQKAESPPLDAKGTLEKFESDLARYKLRAEELEYKVEEINDIWISKSKASEKERNQLEQQLREKEEEVNEALLLYEEGRTTVLQMERMATETEGLLKNKDEMVNRKNELIVEQEEIVKQREQEVQTVLDQMSSKDEELKNVRESLRHRDERLREKDDIIRKLNVELEEKQQELKCMDSVIKETISKLNKGQSDTVTFVCGETDVEKENIRLKSDLEDYISMSETLQDENRNLKAELAKTQQALNEAIVMWDRERSNMQARINIANERARILEVTANQNDKEVIKVIRKEMNILLEEKEKALYELHTCKKEYETATAVRDREMVKLHEELTEKMKLLREEIINGDRLQDEIRKLQLEAEVTGKLKREEVILRKENAAMKVQYETKLGTLEYEYNLILTAAEKMQKEKALNNDIIRGIQRGMSMLKDKHTDDLIRCEEDKAILERQIEESRFIVNQLQMKIEEFKIQLADQERTKAEMANRYATARSSWEIDRATIQSRLNEIEEQLSASAAAHFKAEDRKSKLESDRASERDDQRRLLAEAHELAVGLQQQLRQRDEIYVKERNDLLLRIRTERNEWENQMREKDRRIAEMEKSWKTVHDLQRRCKDLQEKVDSDRKLWEREKTELVRRLSLSRQAQRRDARKVDEVLAGLTRLRELSVLVASSSFESLDKCKKEGLTNSLPDVAVVAAEEDKTADTNTMILDYIKQAMAKIHLATESLGKYTENKKDPKILRRSLSSSEIDALKEEDQLEESVMARNLCKHQNGHAVTTCSAALLTQTSPSSKVAHPADSKVSVSSTTAKRPTLLTKSASIDHASLPYYVSKYRVPSESPSTEIAPTGNGDVNVRLLGYGSLDRASPKSVRRRFFKDEYGRYNAGNWEYMSWPHRKSSQTKISPVNPDEVKTLVDEEMRLLNTRMTFVQPEHVHSQSTTPSEENPYESISVMNISSDEQCTDASAPLQESATSPTSAKDKRRLFKKSKSLDSSLIGSTVAKVGVQVIMPAGAPSGTTASDILSLVKRKFRPVFKKNIDGKSAKRARPSSSSTTPVTSDSDTCPSTSQTVFQPFRSLDLSDQEKDSDILVEDRSSRKDQKSQREGDARARSKSPFSKKWRSSSEERTIQKIPKPILLHAGESAEPSKVWQFSETSV